MRIKYDLQSVAIIAVNYKHAVDKKVSVVSSSVQTLMETIFFPPPQRYQCSDTKPDLHYISFHASLLLSRALRSGKQRD